MTEKFDSSTLAPTDTTNCPVSNDVAGHTFSEPSNVERVGFAIRGPEQVVTGGVLPPKMRHALTEFEKAHKLTEVKAEAPPVPAPIA